jgi:ankyrin repeat protein
MESSIGGFTAKIPCASCHHNIQPQWVLRMAANHGLAINEDQSRQVALRSYSFLKDADSAIQGTHFVDPVMECAEFLAFGKEIGIAPSITTALHARRLASLQRKDGSWVTFDARPPQSSSPFMVTALAVRTLNAYLPASLDQERATRLSRARAWLEATPAISTEDMTYRLLGLAWTDAPEKEIEAAAHQLQEAQREDDGWAQTQARKSDAYATGEALVALKWTGRASAEAFQNGIQFLINSQLEDGSWIVETRLHEVAQISPPKMETGFPHGENQIMSMFGSTWAVAALSLALDINEPPVQELPELRPNAEEWIETVAFGTPEQIAKIDPNVATKLGSTPLMIAANDPAKVKALLNRGADPLAKAKSGQTALWIAATYSGAAPGMRFLVEHGATAKPEPGIQFNSNPLVYAAYANDIDSARVLLDAGASFTQAMMLEGFVRATPVMGAIQLDDVELLREFLKRGLDPNMVDEVPLISRAAIANRREVTKVLLDAGANPTQIDQYNWTPLRHTHGVDHDVNQTEDLILNALK